MRHAYVLPAIAVTLLIACARGEQKAPASEQATRDLQLAPVDTNAKLADVPAPAESAAASGGAVAAKPETVVVYKDRPAPGVTPKPAPAAPPPAAARTLAAGTVISTTNVDSISSKFDTAGNLVKVRVADAVSNDAGKVVIPAGSIVTLQIQAIKWSENKSDKGTLKMSTQNVMVNGTRMPLVGTVSTPAFTYKHRGSSLGDAAKVGGGAAAGAVVGGLIGKGTGAVIGGVLGGAVGAQRMTQTKDNDIFVSPGTPIQITLSEEFTRTAQ